MTHDYVVLIEFKMFKINYLPITYTLYAVSVFLYYSILRLQDIKSSKSTSLLVQDVSVLNDNEAP